MARFALLFVVALSACARTEEFGAGQEAGRDPRSLATRFFAAAEQGDGAAFAELLTPRALQGMQSGEGFQLDGATLEAWEVFAPRFHGDDGEQAEVPVVATIDGQAQNLDVLVRRTEARWSVFGLRISVAEIGEFVVDFEELGSLLAPVPLPEERDPDGMPGVLDEDESGAYFEDAAHQQGAFEAIASTTRRKHDNHWGYNLAAGGRPALEIVREIVEPAGLVVNTAGSLAALERAVHLNARGVSRIDALERVAAAVGLVPIYPEPWNTATSPVLTFAPGRRTWPTALEGPFLIEIVDLEERVPLATARLSLAVRSLGMSPAVLGFQSQMFEHITIKKITDRSGNNLHTEEGVSFLGKPNIQGAYWSDRLTLELSGLLRSVKRIRRLAGRLTLRLPTMVDRISWPRGRVDKRELFGDRTLELVHWGATSRFRFNARPERIALTELRFSATEKDDFPLETLFTDSFGLGENLAAGFRTTEIPERIDVKVCTVKELTYPFALEGIRLLRHEDMPVALEALQFEGLGPVQAEFVRFKRRGDGFPQIAMRLHNTSNKDVLALQTEFHYLDRHGVEVGSFPHSLSGGQEFGAYAPGAIVTRGMTVEETATAFFLPGETVTVRIDVSEVSFSDASRWGR